MSISRPMLLVLVGAVLMGATFLAVTNARDRAADDGSTAAQSQDAEQAAQPTGSLTADQAVAAAFSGSGSLDSGRIAAELSLKLVGGQGQAFSVNVDGKFQSREGKVPLFDFDLSVKTGDGGRRAGAVSLGDRGFLTRGDTGYRVPDAVWTELANARRQITSYAKGGTGSEAGILGVDPRAWLTDVEDKGEAQVDGVMTRHVSARVDATKLVRDLVPLARQGGAQVNLPRNLDQIVSRAVKRADVELWVGSKDRILRRMNVDLELDFSALSAGAADEVGRAQVTLDLDLTGVNETQQIEAPARIVRAPANDPISTAALGLGVLAVDPPAGLSAARKAGFRIGDVTSPAPITDNPRKVARAVRQNRKVVIFFRSDRGLDDQATGEAVRALRRSSEAAVFTDDVRSVERFGKLVEDLGVNQAPSIVVIDRRGNARLIEGYIDARTLAQEVADAR